MSRLLSVGRRTFSALRVPNFRRYYIGQAISLVGTWMQSIAQSWLVYVLTHSATDLGLAVAIQTIPVLVLGPYGGVIADRVDKRRLMIALQAAMGVQALVLGILTVLGAVRFWEILVLALILGINNTFENPARQAFVLEMVGPDEVRNAVSLNSTLLNAARAIGPAVAGILIATVGDGICFLLNAVSFIAVVFSLATMDPKLLQPSPPAGRAKGQVREGFRYVARTPRLAVPLVMMAIVGTLAYEFQVVLPVLAKATFHGGAEAYGFMTAAMGIGAVLGGLVTAARGKTGLRPFTVAAGGFALAIAIAAVSPVLSIELVGLAIVGYASVSFLAIGNTTLQLEADPSMRGRVMSLWAVAFLGTTPIGGPLLGWIIAVSSGRVGLGVGAVSCAVAAAIGAGALWRSSERRAQRTVNAGSPTGVSAVLTTEVTEA
ncbi:MAG: MFS transporter [Acidimicrobiales bacterium]